MNLGSHFGGSSNPQSLNRYAYVLNNPLNAFDPLGLDCVYLNDAGDGVESIDHESDAGGCWGSGGYWADGWVADASWVSTDPNSKNIWIDSSVNGFLGTTYAGSTVNGGNGFSQGPFGLNAPPSVFTTYQPIAIDPGGGGGGGDVPLTNEQKAIFTSAYLQATHQLGCVGMSWAAGAGGSTLFQMSQPVAGSKSFVTPGSSIGTSPVSEALRDAFPQKLSFQVPTPVGGPGTGTSLRLAWTNKAGAAAGRYAPFAGAALMGYSVYKLNQCLSQTPGNP